MEYTHLYNFAGMSQIHLVKKNNYSFPIKPCNNAGTNKTQFNKVRITIGKLISTLN